MSAFDKYRGTVWDHQYRVRLRVYQLHGGVPMDPRVVEGWLKSKIKNRDEMVEELLRETVEELGFDHGSLTDDELNEVVRETGRKGLSGFKRDETSGELFIEGRQIKAMLKEAANIAYPWNDGKTKIKGKGWKSYFAEHVFVPEDRIGLGMKEPTDIDQRFAHTPRGTAIQRDEVVQNAELVFTVVSDTEFDEDVWAKIWLTAELQGIGAARSMGFGTFTIEEWERV